MCVRSSQRLFDPEWPSWVEIYEERISGRGGLKLWTLSIHEEREQSTTISVCRLALVHAYKQAFPRTPRSER